MQGKADQIAASRHAGELMRDWRQRRRLTQADLACAADISVRALGALETGRAVPNRDFVQWFGERLDIPLRDRNALLTAAGYAPAFPVRPWSHQALDGVRAAIEHMLTSHVPYPALAMDSRWVMLSANQPLRLMIGGADPALLRPPVNWARLILHPAGLAPRVANLQSWRARVLTRLRRQFEATGDPTLSDLLEEIGDYPIPHIAPSQADVAETVAEPLRLMTVDGPLNLFCATTAFWSATDVALAELTTETFFPADPETEAIMRRQANAAPPVKAD